MIIGIMHILVFALVLILPCVLVGLLAYYAYALARSKRDQSKK